MFTINDYIKPNKELEVNFTLFIPAKQILNTYVESIYPNEIFRVFSCEYSPAQKIWHVILIPVNHMDARSMIFCEGKAKDFIKIKDKKTLEMISLLYEK